MLMRRKFLSSPRSMQKPVVMDAIAGSAVAIIEVNQPKSKLNVQRTALGNHRDTRLPPQ